MTVLRKAVIKALPQRVMTGPGKRFVFLYHDVSDPSSPQYSPLYSTGIPSSVFVNSTAIKHNRLFYGTGVPSINRTYERKVFLDESDIRELAAKGVVIGSHSSSHKVLAECDETSLR